MVDYIAGKGIQGITKLMGLGMTGIGKVIGTPLKLTDKLISKFIDRGDRNVTVIVPDAIANDP